jgi:hypothetical protein
VKYLLRSQNIRFTYYLLGWLSGSEDNKNEKHKTQKLFSGKMGKLDKDLSAIGNK